MCRAANGRCWWIGTLLAVAASYGGEPVAAKLPGGARDLDHRLQRYHQVEIPFEPAGLTRPQQQLIRQLAEAAQPMDPFFCRQNDPDGVVLYAALARNSSEEARKARRFLRINAGRFDLADGNAPVLATAPITTGQGFAETDTRRHDDMVAELGRLLFRSAEALRAAAALADDPRFGSFLRLRADAILADTVGKTDAAWLRYDGKIDLILGGVDPSFYETGIRPPYGVGIGAAYGAAVLVRDDEATRQLADLRPLVVSVQSALPLPPYAPARRDVGLGLRVARAPFRAGVLRAGRQPLVLRVPYKRSDRHALGGKRFILRDVISARADLVLAPLTARVLGPDAAALVTPDGVLLSTIAHELGHDLGPTYVPRPGPRTVSVEEALGSTFDTVEEAQADALGMLALARLVDRGSFPAGRAKAGLTSYVANLLNQARRTGGDPETRAAILQVSYLSERSALVAETASKRLRIDYARLPSVLEGMARDLVQIQTNGDRARAERWFHTMRMPDVLQALLSGVEDIPMDLDPTFSFPDLIQ
jgi:hypothetical protein